MDHRIALIVSAVTDQLRPSARGTVGMRSQTPTGGNAQGIEGPRTSNR